MLPLRISGFAGTVPRLDRRLLDARQAQVAMNCVLTSGALQPTRLPLEIDATLQTDALAVFRMTSSGTDKWLSWDRDVDVERGPVAGDTTQRIYWTGDGEPRCSDYSTATSGGGPYPTAQYVLGVWAPTAAPGVAYSGTVGTATSRAFVYTFVNAWGEESAPSAASSVVSGGNSGAGQWDLTSLQTAPANTFAVTNASWALGIATLTVASTRGLRVGEEIAVTGMTPNGYNVSRAAVTALGATTVSYAVTSNPGAFSVGGTITRKASHNTSTWKQRFYWTETTATGTDYYYVGEQNAASTATILGNTVAGEALPSGEWVMPPTDMKSLGVLPNGIMFGVSKNELCLSEPFKPYAWPTRYRQTSDFTIVGARAFGTTVVVATEGTPYTLSGVDPTTMGGGMVQIKQEWPCLAKRSMVSFPFGVAYAAPQGLVMIGASQADIVTKDLYTPRAWKALSPSTFVAAVADGRYYAGYQPRDGQPAVTIIDKNEFASNYQANYAVDEFWTDPLSGKLYMLQDSLLYEWEGDIGRRDLYDWMSKEFLFPMPVNLGAAKVDFDASMTPDEETQALANYAATLAANQALITAGTEGGSVAWMPVGELPLGGDLLNDLPVLQFDSLQFNLYVDNRLKFTKNVTSTRAFTLPAGYKSDNCAIRLSGNVNVKSVVLGRTMTELARG